MSAINAGSIHIHGSGFAPLLAAVSLHRTFPALRNGISVSLSSFAHPVRALSTLSDMCFFNRSLKISEQSFMKSCNASFSLGSKYTIAEETHFFSDSDYGSMLDRINFHQLYCAYTSDKFVNYDEFCLAAVLAKKNRFARRDDKRNSPFNSLNYGYQFDDERYFQSLFSVAQALNITIYHDDIQSIEVVLGEVQLLQMKSGLQQRASLYIDCSITRDIVRYTHGVPKSVDNFPRWKRQDYHRSGRAPILPSYNDIIFDFPQKSISKLSTLRSGQYQSDHTFSFTDPLTCTANVLPESWCNNVIALGEAYAVLPNLLLDSYHLIQGQLLQLIEIGRLIGVGEGVKKIVNQTCTQSVNHLIDIDNIHIARLFNNNNLLTSNNQMRVDLFEGSGAVLETGNAIIPDKHWLVLLMAMGFEQKLVDLQSLKLSQVQIDQQLNTMRSLIQRAGELSAGHGHWLEKLGV